MIAVFEVLLLTWLAAGIACADTLRVDHNAQAAYQSIGSAIDALPEEGGEIAIAPGIYREKLFITKRGVHLWGSGKTAQDTVIVFGDSAITAGGTSKSYTVSVSGDDFSASNLTIQNDYWLNSANPPSQAVALMLTSDRAVLSHVRLLGHQDTLYANKGANGRMARQYFSDCYIEGHVDFIFGNAKAFFERCQVHGLAHPEVMYTAQSRNAANEDSGYVFDHCLFTADAGAGEITLGRPWRAYATVVLLHADIRAPVMATGWREWHPGKTSLLPTTFYAEYRSVGPGANPATRTPYSHQLTDSEVARWTLAEFFNHDIDWIGSVVQ